MTDLSNILGTREHAEAVTRGRHPGVQSALQWLAFSHLPEVLRPFAEPFYIAAVSLIAAVGEDSPELITSLNEVIKAKDAAVRAGIQFQQGYPGPMARPQEVVNPPLFGNYGPGQPAIPTASEPAVVRRPIVDRPQA